MIRDDRQLHQAEADVQAFWQFLERAQQTHAAVDYERLAVPYLLQIQERQQDILAYLSIKPAVLPA